MERLTIVSLDGHAQPSPEIWPKYLPKRFHDYLPQLNDENDWYTAIMRGLLGRSHGDERLKEFDFEDAIKNGGWSGLWDRDVRIAEMDREGIAAEVITSGDGRVCAMGYEPTNQFYPLDFCQAGVKAYHRWVADEFGNDKDRLFLIGIVGRAPWRNLDEMLAEVDWVADQGFIATSFPGHTTYLHEPALFDRYWDPFWAKVQERGLLLWMHAGHGEQQGEFGREMAKLHRSLKAKGADFDNLVGTVSMDVFDDGAAFESIKPRRAMWQLMMSGVFDRFPQLKLVVSEIHADWLPATLALLDEAYEQHRSALPAKRKPSEYWSQNCLNGVSFLRNCDLEGRDKFGAHTIGFGRDYPHTEGTWPNTKQWLREVFDGLPADEVKAIASGNAIKFMGLNGAELARIAERIGAPMVEDVTGGIDRPSKNLLSHFNERGTQFLANSEGISRVSEMNVQLQEDLWQMGANIRQMA